VAKVGASSSRSTSQASTSSRKSKTKEATTHHKKQNNLLHKKQARQKKDSEAQTDARGSCSFCAKLHITDLPKVVILFFSLRPFRFTSTSRQPQRGKRKNKGAKPSMRASHDHETKLRAQQPAEELASSSRPPPAAGA
jgi:hypothetical protein